MLNLFKNTKFFTNNFSGFSNNLFKSSSRFFSKLEIARKRFNAKFYEEAKEALPKNPQGLVKLDKKVFNAGVESATCESDIEFLLNVVADYMGNLNPISGNSLDDFLAKAIELGCPNKLITLISNHRSLMYYPDPTLILNIFKLYSETKNWVAMKVFYNTISRKHFIKKQSEVFEIYINNAYANKEHLVAVNAFLDILDYQEVTLRYDTFIKIIYSDQELFLKDSVFVETLENSMQLSKIEGFGTTLPLLVYYHHNKNEVKTKLYFEKLEKAEKDSSSILVHDATFMKEFLTNISSDHSETSSKIKEIIMHTSDIVFDPSYKELLDNIKNK